MNRYEEGLRLIEESCGNGKDNVIALSTIAMGLSADGIPCPYVRDVDAYYEDGVFYVTTWAKSNKMKQIAQNNKHQLEQFKITPKGMLQIYLNQDISSNVLTTIFNETLIG